MQLWGFSLLQSPYVLESQSLPHHQGSQFWCGEDHLSSEILCHSCISFSSMALNMFLHQKKKRISSWAGFTCFFVPNVRGTSRDCLGSMFVGVCRGVWACICVCLWPKWLTLNIIGYIIHIHFLIFMGIGHSDSRQWSLGRDKHETICELGQRPSMGH